MSAHQALKLGEQACVVIADPAITNQSSIGNTTTQLHKLHLFDATNVSINSIKLRNVSCSPDPTSNFQTTNPEFHKFSNQPDCLGRKKKLTGQVKKNSDW